MKNEPPEASEQIGRDTFRLHLTRIIPLSKWKRQEASLMALSHHPSVQHKTTCFEKTASRSDSLTHHSRILYPCLLSSEAGSRGFGAAPQGPEDVSPETLTQAARRHSRAPAPAYSPRGRDGPSFRPISLSLSLLLQTGGPVQSQPVLSSPQPIPGPLNLRDTAASCTVGFPIKSSSRPPTSAGQANADNSSSATWGASANREQPCCAVQNAIATDDACRGIAVATRDALGPPPSLQAEEAASDVEGCAAATSPEPRATCEQVSYTLKIFLDLGCLTFDGKGQLHLGVFTFKNCYGLKINSL